MHPWPGEGGAHLLTLLNQARHLETCGTQGPAPPGHPREWPSRGCTLVHSHPFSRNVWLWVPTKPRIVTIFLDQQGMCPQGPCLPHKHTVLQLGVDLWLSVFNGGHPGGLRANTWEGLLFFHLRILSF